MGSVVGLIELVIQILIWLIIFDAILTWIPSVDRRNPLVKLIRSITQPILEPFRKLLPPQKTGYVDLSPLLAIIVLQIIAALI